MQISDATARANAGVWLGPRGHPGAPGPCARAQRALPEPGSVPCRSAACQCKLGRTACDRRGMRRVGRGGAGRCGAAVFGQRVRGRPVPKGTQELHQLHKCRGCAATRGSDTSLLGRRATGSTPTWRPWSTFLIATGPLCRPRGARAARRGATGDSSCPRKRAVGIFSAGDKHGWGVKNTYAVPPAPSPDAEHSRGSARRPNPTYHPPALASSIGGARCWLGTTPPEGRPERYTTAPGAVQRRP